MTSLAMYGISHWCFKDKRFTLTDFSSEGEPRLPPNSHQRDFQTYVPYDFEDLYSVKSTMSHETIFLPNDKKTLPRISLYSETNTRLPYDYRFNEIHQFSMVLYNRNDESVVLPSQRVQSKQDKSKDQYKILDEERCCQKQGVHVRYPETAKDTTYLPKSGYLYWWTDSEKASYRYWREPE
ncbi:hypothetical protein Tco_0759884 [Tanacetum coccineum]